MNALLSRFVEATAAADRSAALLVKLTLLLAAAWLVHAALRRANPRWRVLLWRASAVSMLIVLLLSLVGPTISLALLPPIVAGGSNRPSATSRAMADSQAVTAGSLPSRDPDALVFPDAPPLPTQPTAVAHVAIQPAGATPADRPAAVKRPWTLATYLWVLWAIGLLIGALREALSVVRLARLRRRAVPVDVALAAEAADISARLNYSKPFDVLATSELASPCVIGVWRPAILLPGLDGSSLAGGELAAVFAHEIQHLKNADLPWNTFLRTLGHLLWFHPLVWRVRAAHAAACDAVCDAAAADFMGDVAAYCRTLARLALRVAAPLPETGFAMARASTVRRRIEALNRRLYASPVSRWARGVALVTGLAAAGLLGSVAITRAENEADKPPAANQPVRRVELAGAVRDEAGRPISAADVYIYYIRRPGKADWLFYNCFLDEPTKVTRSDDQGHFSFGPVDASLRFDLLAVSPGRQAQLIKGVDPAAGRDITLEPWKIPDEPNRVYQATLVDQDGRPVAGARVKPQPWEDGEGQEFGAVGQSDLVSVSDAAGKFVLVFAPGGYPDELQVMAEGLCPLLLAGHRGGPFKNQVLPAGLADKKIVLDGGTIATGRIVDQGQGVAGVRIVCSQVTRAMGQNLGTFYTTTDAQGRFAIRELPRNEEMVAAPTMETLGRLGAVSARTFTTVADGTLDLGELPVEKAYRIAGWIILSDGRPFPVDAEVIVRRPGAGDWTTVEIDAAGRFAATGVPAEIISLGVYVTGYQLSPKNKSADPQSSESLEGQITGDTTDLIILCEPNKPWVQDRSPQFVDAWERFQRTRTEPIAGVTAALERATSQVLPGQPGAPLPIPHVDISPRHAFPPQTAEPARVVSGTVTDEEGKPVAKAEVWLPVRWLNARETLTATAKADAQGRFRLSIPEAWFPKDFDGGSTEVWGAAWAGLTAFGYAPGYAFGESALSAQLGPESQEEPVQLDKPCEIKLPRESELSVSVVLPDGSPAAGAKVTASGGHSDDDSFPSGLADRIAVTTGADGRARLPALRYLWNCDFVVTLDGLGQQVFRVEFQGRDTPEPKLQLRPAARVEGRLGTDQLELVRGLVVAVGSSPFNSDSSPTATGWATAIVDEQGRFVVPEIACGSIGVGIPWDYNLPVWPHGTGGLVKEGETCQIEIPLEACVRVHGVVRASDTGKPFAKARVWVGDDGQSIGSYVTTDEQGAYTAFALPGNITTRFAGRAKGYRQLIPWHENIQVPRGQPEFDLPAVQLVPTIEVPGKLVDAEGNPVAGAQVQTSIGRAPCYTRPFETGKDGLFTLYDVPAGSKFDEFWITFAEENRGNYRGELVSDNPLVVRLGLSDKEMAELIKATQASGELQEEPARPTPGQPDKK